MPLTMSFARNWGQAFSNDKENDKDEIYNNMILLV